MNGFTSRMGTAPLSWRDPEWRPCWGCSVGEEVWQKEKSAKQAELHDSTNADFPDHDCKYVVWCVVWCGVVWCGVVCVVFGVFPFWFTSRGTYRPKGGEEGDFPCYPAISHLGVRSRQVTLWPVPYTAVVCISLFPWGSRATQRKFHLLVLDLLLSSRLRSPMPSEPFRVTTSNSQYWTRGPAKILQISHTTGTTVTIMQLPSQGGDPRHDVQGIILPHNRPRCPAQRRCPSSDWLAGSSFFDAPRSNTRLCSRLVPTS